MDQNLILMDLNIQANIFRIAETKKGYDWLISHWIIGQSEPRNVVVRQTDHSVLQNDQIDQVKMGVLSVQKFSSGWMVHCRSMDNGESDTLTEQGELGQSDLQSADALF